MVTANVRFLTNNLVADMTCTSENLAKNLKKIGILTPLSLIKLDNARTLQIELTPNNEIGELVCNIVNPNSDTLGNVHRLCRHIYCFNEQHRATFIDKLESGKINTVNKGLKFAEKLRAENSVNR